MSIFFVFLSSQARASSFEKVLNVAEQLKLADDPIWRKLLHYERGSNHSVVLTDDFFLSPMGKNNLDAELKATIGAYFVPWNEKSNNEHARCRFPARYYWLSQKLFLPNYNVIEEYCQSLEKWALLDSIKSISLLLVSGYFGNPASTFGHSLLKFNTDSTDDQNGLFDLTLNYGALIPENEYALRYIKRGILGGYEAGFSDRYFYTQDLVYSRKEFRDIWDYKLALSNYERTLLILHIWEIVGKKFTYYFLDKNCAYRLAELLELVIKEDLLDNVRFWYVPIKLFHSLNDIDKIRYESNKKNLIQSIRYIPSSQRKLYHQLKLLNSNELRIFNSSISDSIRLLSPQFSILTVKQKILVLDSLLEYQQYRIIADGSDVDRDRKRMKDQVLLARLRLPARPRLPVVIPELNSPAEGSRPMEMGMSIVSNDNEDSFLCLHWSPFKKEMVGRNSLEGDEFVVFDLAVGISENAHAIFVDRFDLFRVLNLNTLSVQVVDESQLSWQLRVGMDRVNENEENRYDGVVSFGAGQARKWHKYIIGYGMIDFSAHTLFPVVRVRPYLGLKLDLGELRSWLYWGVETRDYSANVRGVWGGKIQYQFSDRFAVRVELSNENITSTSIGLNWYW